MGKCFVPVLFYVTWLSKLKTRVKFRSMPATSADDSELFRTQELFPRKWEGRRTEKRKKSLIKKGGPDVKLRNGRASQQIGIPIA